VVVVQAALAAAPVVVVVRELVQGDRYFGQQHSFLVYLYLSSQEWEVGEAQLHSIAAKFVVLSSHVLASNLQLATTHHSCLLA